MKKIFAVVVLSFLMFSLVSAGLGIKYSEESALINEGDEKCLTYSVYNPWPDDSNVIIDVSSELQEVMVLQEAETKFVPAFTSSENALPIKFCFKVPKVYQRDCAVGSFLCELQCQEETKVYEGEVAIRTIPKETQMTGTGGSATAAVIGAPLRVRVACNPHSRDYTLLYAFIAVFSVLIVASVLIKRYRKPKVERDKERLKKLKDEIKKESKKKK